MYGFADLVRARGGDPIELVRDAGLDPSCLTDGDQFISWRRLAMALELAADRLAMPSFALTWSGTLPSDFPNAGPIMLMAAFSETFEEWFRLGLQYWRLHTDAYSLQLINDPAQPHVIVRYRTDDSEFSPRQVMELSVANCVRLARGGTGIDAELMAGRFRHCAPADVTPHRTLFRCEVEFGAEHDEVLLDRAYLAAQAGGRPRPVRGLVSRYVRRRIGQTPIYDQTIRATVALAIPSVMGTGYCNLDFIANSLGLSPKKMQRLLQQEGTSFSEVLEKVRQDMATRMVGTSNAPIANVAGLLGYSTSPPFTLAFRRWTGTSPREFRKAGRGQ